MHISVCWLQAASWKKCSFRPGLMLEWRNVGSVQSILWTNCTLKLHTSASVTSVGRLSELSGDESYSASARNCSCSFLPLQAEFDGKILRFWTSDVQLNRKVIAARTYAPVAATGSAISCNLYGCVNGYFSNNWCYPCCMNNSGASITNCLNSSCSYY